jgi:hypothetical protein
MVSKNVKIKIYRTIILPIVLYGCEACCFRLREENRLRAYLGLGGMREHVTGRTGMIQEESDG